MTEAPTRLRPPPVYSSAAGEEAIRQLYAKALGALPFPHDQLLVDTPSFGTVHVVVCGDPSAPPLVLWHGTASPAPFALLSFQPLVARFRVYAPDLPCQAGGRSEAVVLDQATHDHGRWCAEVLEALELLHAGKPPPLHVGMSVGGAMLMDLALVRPEAIGAAALVVPGCLHPDSDSKLLLLRVVGQFALSCALYRLLPCRATSYLALLNMCDEPDGNQLELENMKLAFRHQAYFPPPPLKFTDEQLQRLAAPVLVVCAEHDLFGPGEATVARARQVFPDCEAMLLRGARHLLSRSLMWDVNQQILGFFASRGLAAGGAPVEADLGSAPSESMPLRQDIQLVTLSRRT